MFQLIESTDNSVTVTLPKETTSNDDNTYQTTLSKISVLLSDIVSINMHLDTLNYIMCMREKFIKKGKKIDEELKLLSDIQKSYSVRVEKFQKLLDDPNIDILKIDPQFLDRLKQPTLFCSMETTTY